MTHTMLWLNKMAHLMLPKNERMASLPPDPCLVQFPLPALPFSWLQCLTTYILQPYFKFYPHLMKSLLPPNSPPPFPLRGVHSPLPLGQHLAKPSSHRDSHFPAALRPPGAKVNDNSGSSLILSLLQPLTQCVRPAPRTHPTHGR